MMSACVLVKSLLFGGLMVMIISVFGDDACLQKDQYTCIHKSSKQFSGSDKETTPQLC